MTGGKVVVGYLHRQDVAATFHESMLDLYVWDLQREGRILGGGGRISAYAGAGRIPEARNKLVASFLDAHTAEWLFMVDDDMGFLPDTVERLVEAADPKARPVVGGLCYGQKLIGVDAFHSPVTESFPTLYVFSEAGGAAGFFIDHDFPEDTVKQYAATGAACLLIHRTAVEKVRQAEGDSWFTPVQLNGEAMGEDISFCVRLAKANIPLHVHTGVETTHQKTQHLRRPRPQAAEPTFVVMPARDRHEMTNRLIEQIAPQCERVFLFDNESDPPYGSHLGNVEVIDAQGMGLHVMWNAGLTLAEEHADGRHFNVAVLNNDLEVPGDFLALLAAGLRAREDVAISYPNWHPVDLPRGQFLETSGNSARTLSGWAFMLRGELGYRFDEQFEWWYGDDDIQAQVEADKRAVLTVGVECRHLEPNKSTEASPKRQAMARRDKKRFEAKWPDLVEAQRTAQRQAREQVPA